jgi:hypothetical protein
VNEDSSPLTVLVLYFASVTDLLATLAHTNTTLLHRSDGTPLLPDITNPEIFLFLAIILQMGHDVQDRRGDY